MGIEITEARGDTDILPSSSQHGVRLVWRGGGIKPPMPQKAWPYSPVNLTPMGSIHASTIGALVGGNRNLSQGWGTYPQLNWRLPTNATKGHNATKATKPSRVPMNPREKNLLNFSPSRILTENSNRCTKCNGKNTRSAQILLSQIQPKLQKLVGE